MHICVNFSTVYNDTLVANNTNAPNLKIKDRIFKFKVCIYTSDSMYLAGMRWF